MSALISYVQKGLQNCYMADKGCWSYIYHLDGRANPNESLPAWDTFYSLNVILGLAALKPQNRGTDFDLPALLHHNARRLFELPVPKYALGTALWASAQLGVPLEAPVAGKIRDFIKDKSRWIGFRAQDAGMILTGISEQKARGNNEWDEIAQDLFNFILVHYRQGSKLFINDPKGWRKNYSSFATQTYLTNAFYHFGLRHQREDALKLADESVTKLISMQGPNGEWPWFYYAPGGIVADNYEVYSVHQHGMAPLFLTFAEQRGVPGAHEALVKGFQWIFGQNQLQRSMMVPELGMFYRSIIRQGELTNKKKRMTRSVVNGLLGRTDPYISPDKLTLRLECRSYELGWILYSFGNRDDLPHIINHPAFTVQEERKHAV